MKTKKLNQIGFSHDLVLVLFLLIFAIAGVGYIVASHADSPAVPKSVKAYSEAKQSVFDPHKPTSAAIASAGPALSKQFTAAGYRAPAGYHYVQGFENTRASGVSAYITVGDPTLGSAAGAHYAPHSLAQIGIVGPTGQDDVEFGWNVDPNNHDYKAHLFVYDAIKGWNGGQGCYNGCGYVQVSNKVAPGDMVYPGTRRQFAIIHQTNRWWVIYNGTKMGYYPDSVWKRHNVTLTYGVREGAWGEVYEDNGYCTQMGRGVFPSNPRTATISGFKVYGAAVQSNFLPVLASNPTAWNFNSATTTSFNFGGPGYCR